MAAGICTSGHSRYQRKISPLGAVQSGQILDPGVCRGPCYCASMKCLLALLLISIGTSGSVGDSYQSIFIIERSTDAKVIHYDAKIGSDGAIDPKEPVIAYWVMVAENGRRQGFNALEKSLAYGLTIHRSKDRSTSINRAAKCEQLLVLESTRLPQQGRIFRSWCPSSIRTTLRNERCRGQVIWGKTIKVRSKAGKRIDRPDSWPIFLVP